MSVKMDEQVFLVLFCELVIDSQWVEYFVIVFIEEYYVQGIELFDQGIKNLFLCNCKGICYYLVLFDECKEVDLLGIVEQIGESCLLFVLVECLCEYFGVELGCVMFFVLVNDLQYRVEVLFDDVICQDQLFGFYLLVNIVIECICYVDLLVFFVYMGYELCLIWVQVVVLCLLVLGQVVLVLVLFEEVVLVVV